MPCRTRALRLLPLLALCLLWAAGCSRTRPAADLDVALPDAFPHHTAEQVRYFLTQGVDTLFAFDAKASLGLDSPERRGSFSGDLRSREADSLYLSISPGLGIEAMRALVTPDSFFVYDRLKKRVYYGAAEDAGDLLPPGLTANDLFAALLGIDVPPAGWTLRADSAHYYLTDPYGRRTYTVDPALWRVTRYEERTADGRLVEERRFSNFDRFRGLILPRRAVFRRPLEASTLSIYYRDLDLNPRRIAFDLRVSSDARYEPVR